MDLLSSCPPWCQDEVPTDDGGVIHFSGQQTVSQAAVSVERRGGVAAIRLEASTEPMTPMQAFQLAAVLQAAAVTALLDGQVLQ